jgi:hypothetical protein
MSGVAGARTAAGICQEMSVMEHYEVCEVLGEGTSGTVHRLKRRKTTTPSLTYSDNVSTNVEGEVFAGKRLDASSEQNVKDFYVEVQRLLDFSSESTIEVYGSYLFEGEAWVSISFSLNECTHDSDYSAYKLFCTSPLLLLQISKSPLNFVVMSNNFKLSASNHCVCIVCVYCI